MCVCSAPLPSSLCVCVCVCVVGVPGILEKEDADSVFMEMICPSGTNPDDSPLYVLCCNDTCSFTWTGAEHINQVRAASLCVCVCVCVGGQSALSRCWADVVDFYTF